MFSWRITSIAFSGGDVVPLEPASLLLLIGPNSSGKSEALRNIQSSATGENTTRPVVPQVSVTRSGQPHELEKWFNARYPKRMFSGYPHFTTRPGANIRVDQLLNHWGQGDQMPGLAPFLISSLDTASRTTSANYVRAINIWEEAPQAFVHVLQAAPGLEERVNLEIRGAFGRDLVIDWSALPNVGFRVGSAPERTPEQDRVSEEYAVRLRELPMLDNDGDGIRSFAGCVLATYCGSQPVLLIDEPEAFLHPPQARRLGAALAKAARDSDRQVIVATHSADIVQGALNADGRVAVCRLTREDDVNPAALLDAGQLKQLWSKPLLRSSAAIDGLFHTGVVVCEADSDVRLYDAAIRRAQTAGRLGLQDLYFAQGGGKGELATLAAAYGSLKTRTAVIADLDLMRNPVEHHKVLVALGSELNTGDPRYKSVMSALADAPPIRDIDSAIADIRTAVEEIERDREVGRSVKERISVALQESSKFSQAKRHGISKLRGAVLLEAKALLHEWEQIGLFLVPVGELEGWWPEGPANSKAEWIAGAVEELARDGTMQDLDRFVGQVARFFGGDPVEAPPTP